MHMQRHITRLSLSLLFLGVLSAASAAPYAEYRVTIVGPPGSVSQGINQSGTIIGNTRLGTNNYRSFINYGRGPIDLGLLGGVSNEVVAINDRGEVLGNWITTSGQKRAYVYHRGSFRQIAGIPGRTTQFLDINNRGYILAKAPDPSPSGEVPTVRSYLRAPNGKYRDLGAPPFENLILELNVLNNRNQVAGWAAPFTTPEIAFNIYFWNKGVLRQLDNSGNTPNYALAINDRGQVAGSSATEVFRAEVATIWTHGRPTRIDPHPLQDYPFSKVTLLNNHGHAVGTSVHLGLFIYRGRKMENINSLINPGSGWNIVSIRGINDAGQLAATGWHDGVQYAVRLDLIRPHALGTPYIAPDDEEQEVDAGADEE